MTESRKTIFYAAAAVLLAGLAFVTAPHQKMPTAFFDQGQQFFPDFTDPNSARSLEVDDWDEATGQPVPFKVTFDNGRWTIPSHHGYPADGKDRLAKTAAGLIGLTKDDFRTDNVADFEACGVIDPLDNAVQTLKGRGRRVTIKGANGEVLADLIIGKAFEGREDFRLVRVPGQKRVYGTKINLDISTKFKDWIDPDLTMLEKDEIDRVNLRDYSIDEQSGRLDQRDDVTLNKDGENWKMAGLPAGKDVDTYKINSLISAVDALSIEGVRPKPDGLTASLQRASGGISITNADLASLQSHGFYFTRDGRLVSNEGELQVHTKDGVLYTLRFGEVAFGQGTALSAGDSLETRKQGETGENRYLMISASMDASLKDQKAIDAAKKRVDDLNGHFAKWYYVISAQSFDSIHLKRKDLVKDKPKAS
ncbi:MAG TPA: DUF4340 domain-containing protein [Candidatus Krumholzibacteria bacterium]|nr:DUF4340 domain-containing protein [Candidatus Krumholzibacteria bacterium]